MTMTMPSLVQSLFEGPIDVVGDVHGEIDALRSLLGHLGYDDQGLHPEGRRLVFVGDLTDRGPDSPSVVALVQSLVDAERAQCVLGNHELNIILDRQKKENRWFYGKEFRDEHGNLAPQVLADDGVQKSVMQFFGTFPLARERDDVRVVHACWSPEMIEVARAATSVVDLYIKHEKIIKDSFAAQTEPDTSKLELAIQNENPVKVLTSGLEQPTAIPYHAGGKLRTLERVAWWQQYRDPQTCVFGHYGIPDGKPHETGAPRCFGQACCVDFAVARRWEGRLGRNLGFRPQLAALRLPERQVIFDDGRCDSSPFGAGATC